MEVEEGHLPLMVVEEHLPWMVVEVLLGELVLGVQEVQQEPLGELLVELELVEAEELLHK